MNRKPLNQPRKEPKPDVAAKDFKMYKNGFLNTRTPRGFNWITGHAEGAPAAAKRVRPDTGLPLQTVNGQRVVQ